MCYFIQLKHPDIWDAPLCALINASIAKIDFNDYMTWISNTSFSLVHGDFHPANVMWIVDSREMRLIDWEMIGVGNGPQVFFISECCSIIQPFVSC